MTPPLNARPASYVCVCLRLTKQDVIQAIHDHRLTSLDEVVTQTAAGMHCGTCIRGVAACVRRELEPGLFMRLQRR